MSGNKQLIGYQDLVNATTLLILDQTLKAILADLGFNTFAFTYYGSDFYTSKTLKHNFATNDLEKWHQHFHKNNYEQLDTFGKEVRNSLIPLAWNAHKQIEQADAKSRVIYEDALAFGNPGSGLAIPIHGAHDQFAILSVHHADIDELIKKNPALPYDLQILAIYYQHYMTRLLFEEIEHENQYQLTLRELQCLTLTAQNKNAEEVASVLDVSKRTVGFHIENANRKLGVKNKFEAVQLALAKHIIMT